MAPIGKKQLADKLKISTDTLSRWMQKYQVPNYNKNQKLITSKQIQFLENEIGKIE